ncbi:MAG: DUF1064 domain-containing protein [Clostridia bacterium]|nr:DUF1064 domain-containing protein [Clostridia bacterium]
MRSNSKYGAAKTIVDGMTFDSRKEANRYLELSMLEQAGCIEDLRRQVKFVLIPTQREEDTVGKRGGIKPGKVLEKECAYIADFVYRDADGHTVVEDTKGVKTKDYIIKRKLMLYVHGIRIREV